MSNTHIKRTVCIIMSIAIIASCLPVQAFGIDTSGSGGGGTGTGHSTEAICWGDIPNQHSGIRVSIVDTEGNNKTKIEVKAANGEKKDVYYTVDILGESLYNNRNTISHSSMYVQNKFGDEASVAYTNIKTVKDRMKAAINEFGYGHTGQDKIDFANKLDKNDGNGNYGFPNSVKNVGSQFTGNGKAVRSFFLLGSTSIDAFETATKITLDGNIKLGNTANPGNMSIKEYDKKMKELESMSKEEIWEKVTDKTKIELLIQGI